MEVVADVTICTTDPIIQTTKMAEMAAARFTVPRRPRKKALVMWNTVMSVIDNTDGQASSITVRRMGPCVQSRCESGTVVTLSAAVLMLWGSRVRQNLPD